MRAPNVSSMLPSVLMTAALAVASPALAATFNVGDGTAGSYDSLRDAIEAANTAGFVGLPHEIVIDSDDYNPVAGGDFSSSLSCSDQQPLNTLYVPVTIRSTAGASGTAAIPPVSSRSALTLEGLTVNGGKNRTPDNWSQSYNGESCNAAAIIVYGGELTLIDSVLAPGPRDVGSHAVRVQDSDLTIENTTFTGWDDGIVAERRFSIGALTLDILDSTFRGVLGTSDDGIIAEGYDAVVTDSEFEAWDEAFFGSDGQFVFTGGRVADNGAGVIIGDGALDVSDTDFDNNSDIALGVIGQYRVGDLSVRNATFTDNGSFDGNEQFAGAILYINTSPVGGLTVDDSTFSGNQGFLGGSVLAVGHADFNNITVTGSAENDAERGGFLYLAGSGSIRNSTFSDLVAFSGGAIVHTASFEGVRTGSAHLDISDSTFTGMTAFAGGVLQVMDGATTTVSDVVVDDAMAFEAGGFALLNQIDDPFRQEKRGDELRGLLIPRPEYSLPGTLYVDGLQVSNTAARNGGVFAAARSGNELIATRMTIDATSAAALDIEEERLRGLPPGLLSGRGGLLWANDDSDIDISASTITNASAETYGGLIYSGPVEEGFLGPQGERPIPSNEWCQRPDSLSYYSDSSNRSGNRIVLDGVVGTSLSAGQQGGVAIFANADVVSIHRSDFTDVQTSELPRRVGDQLPSSGPAHILTENVASFDMTCTEICDGGGGASHVVRHYEAPQFSRDPLRRPILTHENNIFSYNELTQSENQGAVVTLDVCGTLPDIRDTGFFGEETVVGEGTGEGTGGDSGVGDTDLRDPGDGVPGPAGRRGLFSMTFNTFVGSDDAVLIGGSGQSVPVRLSNNLLSGGDVGISFTETLLLSGGYNLYDDIDMPADDAAAAIFPAATDVTGTAQFWNDVPECDDQQLYLMDGSPGQDQGDPDLMDWWDGSIADIGAYGGPNACFPDDDDDGFIVVLDCDDQDREIRPGANETPYDGIDQDCDGEDECDVDADGFLSDADSCGGDDCDDARADVNPDATEIFYDGIDQDCSGDDCDQDGDGYAANNEECGGPDCDDTDASIFPGAPETDDDRIDSNCDGEDNIPAGCDQDGDGVISDSEECGGIDCDDADPTIYPGAPEIAGDNIDSDCDGDVDPPVSLDDCDADGDGAIAVECGGIDCDDTDASIHPGAEDIPYDGIDQDCDGEDNCDADLDGYAADNEACGGDDCDDTDPTINPEASEIFDDGIDQDCDGEDDQLFVQGGPGGCDCSTTGGSAPMGLMWLGALALVAVRRRRS